MTNQDEEFVNRLKIEDVPWGKLTTAYGRAADFPEYLATLDSMQDREEMEYAFGEIGSCIEHQGTLWHSTPFALIFLVRIYREAAKQEGSDNADWLVGEMEDLFDLICTCYHDVEEDMEEDEPRPPFSDMLKEEYLWPEDLSEEEEDEYWQQGYDDDLFASIYHYSYELVKEFE
ncbi:MAG: hypothetical protein K2N63_08790 [Lachnospiraceae bacterium]|nr:hypothetical protein [Lachnospiraceae bacterium]